MNAIRVTSYPPTPEGTPDSFDPLTMVVLESDLRDDVSLAEAMMGQLEVGDPLGVFVVAETFDVADDCDIATATFQAIERQSKRNKDERYMACLYHFEARALRSVTAHGTLIATEPAPLAVEDVAYALRRLATHPDYKQQQVLFCVEDKAGIRKNIRLIDGEVMVEASE